MRGRLGVLVACVCAGVLAVACLSTQSHARVVTGTYTGAAGGATVELLGSFVYDTTPPDVAYGVFVGNVTEDEAGLLRVRYTSELAYEFETNVHIALHSEAAGVEAQLDATAGVIDCDEWLASAALSVHVGMVPGFEGRVTSGLSQVIAETVRPRKYYVTVVNCRDPEGTGLGAGPLSAPLFYTITFLNPGGTYRRHFSYDEQGQLEAFIAFVVLDVLFALCGCCVYYSEKRVEAEGRLEYPRLLVLAMVAELASVSCLLGDLAVYANEGETVPYLSSSGWVLDGLGQALLLGALIGLGTLWRVDADRCGAPAMVVAVSALLLLTLGYAASAFWPDLSGDAEAGVANHYYLFTTEPGIAVLCMRSVLMLWFLVAMSASLRRTTWEERTAVLQQVCCFGCVWATALCMALVIGAAAPHWHRLVAANVYGKLIATVSPMALLLIVQVNGLRAVMDAPADGGGGGGGKGSDPWDPEAGHETPRAGRGGAVQDISGVRIDDSVRDADLMPVTPGYESGADGTEDPWEAAGMGPKHAGGTRGKGRGEGKVAVLRPRSSTGRLQGTGRHEHGGADYADDGDDVRRHGHRRERHSRHGTHRGGLSRHATRGEHGSYRRHSAPHDHDRDGGGGNVDMQRVSTALPGSTEFDGHSSHGSPHKHGRSAGRLRSGSFDTGSSRALKREHTIRRPVFADDNDDKPVKGVAGASGRLPRSISRHRDFGRAHDRGRGDGDGVGGDGGVQWRLGRSGSVDAGRGDATRRGIERLLEQGTRGGGQLHRHESHRRRSHEPRARNGGGGDAGGEGSGGDRDRDRDRERERHREREHGGDRHSHTDRRHGERRVRRSESRYDRARRAPRSAPSSDDVARARDAEAGRQGRDEHRGGGGGGGHRRGSHGSDVGGTRRRSGSGSGDDDDLGGDIFAFRNKAAAAGSGADGADGVGASNGSLGFGGRAGDRRVKGPKGAYPSFKVTDLESRDVIQDH